MCVIVSAIGKIAAVRGARILRGRRRPPTARRLATRAGALYLGLRHAHKPGQSASAGASPSPQSDSPPACGRAGRLRDPHLRSRLGRVHHPRPDAGPRPPRRRAADRSAAPRPVRRGAWSSPAWRASTCCFRWRSRRPRPSRSTPSTTRTAASFTPVGDRLGGGDLGQKLADIFAGGGGVQYYLMAGDGGDQSVVHGRPRRRAPSPARRSSVRVDGKVTAIKKYSILGRYDDVEIDIRLASDPSLLLVVTHVAKPKVEIGDVVQRGTDHAGLRARLPGLARPVAEPVHLRQRRPRAADDAARHTRPGRPVSAVSAVPAATRAVIGGSGSLAADFPGDLHPGARRS